MSYDYKFHATEKSSRLEAGWAKVPQDVFARLGVTTDTLRELDAQMLGEIIMPGMSEYEKARRGQGLTPFDKASPQIVFACEDAHDVWQVLRAIRQHGWQFVTRSGGHSTAGYSSDCECVIDLAGLDSIAKVDDSRVSVGPGATFRKLNRYMKAHKRHIPTGSCEDVRCGGYMQGGGYGFTSRQFGMQCDCVVEVTVLLADGRTVIANENCNADLFWAIRGGTGNNFGIVVNIVYETVPLEKVWGFVLTWSAADAAEAMHVAQNVYSPDGGLEIGYMSNITTVKHDDKFEPVYMISGICIHGEEIGMKALQPLLAVGSPQWRVNKTDYYIDVNDALGDQLPGIPQPIGDTYEIKSSGYLAKPMSQHGWQAMFDYFANNMEATNPYNLVVIEPYGGAINSVAWDDTAFIHRDVRMDIYIDAFWRATPGLGDYDSAKNWLDGYDKLLAPHLNGHWYQNYPQRDMANYRWQYFGDAYNGLLFVKAKFDPDNVFRYEQSITPYPEAGDIDRSTVPSKWSDETIVCSGISDMFGS